MGYDWAVQSQGMVQLTVFVCPLAGKEKKKGVQCCLNREPLAYDLSECPRSYVFLTVAARALCWANLQEENKHILSVVVRIYTYNYIHLLGGMRLVKYGLVSQVSDTVVKQVLLDNKFG